MMFGPLMGIESPKVAKFPKTTMCTNPDLVIGMELEIEGCEGRSSEELTNACRKSNFAITTDGSLRGVAYEFISKPMPSNMALAALERFLTLTKFDDSNYSDRCSVHVHVNCTDLEPEQVAGVALLYSVVEEILFEFVGHDRDTNIYCIPWNQCRAHWELVNRFLTNPSEAMKGWNKYTALNLLPLREIGTIEFRQMHGTADMEKLTTWINIIGSLFHVGTTTQLNDLIQQIKELNTSSHYQEFFTSIFGQLLPYNDTYRQKLEEGVIYAKYSLTKSVARVVRPAPTPRVRPIFDETTVWTATPFHQPRPQVNEAAEMTREFDLANPPPPTPRQPQVIARRTADQILMDVLRDIPLNTIRTHNQITTEGNN